MSDVFLLRLPGDDASLTCSPPAHNGTKHIKHPFYLSKGWHCQAETWRRERPFDATFSALLNHSRDFSHRTHLPAILHPHLRFAPLAQKGAGCLHPVPLP
jgi:hypothetical protein